MEEWTPEPLVAAPTPFEEADLDKRPVLVGYIETIPAHRIVNTDVNLTRPTSPKAKLSNNRNVINLASLNYYNLADQQNLKEKAITTLKTYGVGPCSPPGFYGTQDVHMQTEADIAAHIGVPECIMYAQAFSTISSVIPSFSKRGDIIVADSAISYATRKGIQISRSTLRWYNHNDSADLERVLQTVVHEQAGRPLTRRFIVTEGLFENVGDLADLPALVDLKLRYKFRLILEESHSYGVLGRTGRGLAEHQNVDPTLVDMIVGSLAGALCAGGGFCAGDKDIVEHQRISSASYTFSAALPAMLSTVASETIRLLQEKPEMVKELREATRVLRAQIDPRSEFVRCTSDLESPLLVVVLKDEVVSGRGWGREDQEAVLQEVVDECLVQGVLVTRMKSMPRPLGVADRDLGWQIQPAVKVCATTGLSRKELEKAGTVVRHAIVKTMGKRR